MKNKNKYETYYEITFEETQTITKDVFKRSL